VIKIEQDGVIEGRGMLTMQLVSPGLNCLLRILRTLRISSLLLVGSRHIQKGATNHNIGHEYHLQFHYVHKDPGISTNACP
jgi:hypothetical protein